MAFIQAKKYYFKSHAGKGRYMNVYGNETVSDTTNVCLYDKEPVNAQKWQIRPRNGNYKIYTALSSGLTFALNIHSASNPNCTMYTADGNDNDSLVTLIEDSSTGMYKIKLVNYNLYLYAEGSSNLSNVKWASLNSSDEGFFWQLIDGDTAAGEGTVTNSPVAPVNNISNVNITKRYNDALPFKNTLLTIKNIPDKALTLDTCCFHYGSGFKTNNTDFSSTSTSSDGYKIKSLTNTFANKVFGKNITETHRCYYLYGEAKTTSNTLFHPGVDFQGIEGDYIHALFGGTVTHSQGTHGDVCIYNKALNVTFIYLHMKNITICTGCEVFPGEIIGQQSSVGPLAQGSHLHFEVRAGRVEGPASEAVANDKMTTILPYGYMDGIL